MCYKKLNSMAFSPQANYTDRTAAAKLVPKNVL
jgi:hypothetical protein